MKKLEIEIPKGMQVDLDKSDLSKGLVYFKEVEFVWPKSVDEIPRREYYLNNNGDIGCNSVTVNNIHMSTYERAYEISALIQLLELIDYVNQGWVPDWGNNSELKYCIVNINTEIYVSPCMGNRVIHFKDSETAEKFLDKYRDLIDIAKNLI